MNVASLSLRAFRNYRRLDLDFATGVHLFVGANGQGKTNLLEAVYLLSAGSSFRAMRPECLVQHGESLAEVTAMVSEQGQDTQLAFRFGRGLRAARVDETPCRRLSDFVGHLSCVIFSAEDLALISGPPALRRRFLDRIIFGLHSEYLGIARGFSQVLRQRNALLRKLSTTTSPSAESEAFLDAWDEPYIAAAVRVLALRWEVFARLADAVCALHEQISGDVDSLRLSYRASAGAASSAPTEDALRGSLETALRRRRAEEKSRGATLVGPHRDDLAIVLAGREAASHASRGQIKGIVLALKLAEMELYRRYHDRRPVLLVDDVAAEFDRTRSERLFELMAWADQAFVTATSDEVVPRIGARYQVYHVESGSVERRA
ncbi:MAG: DNA replication/repair protein RecF [Candidatus Schekmanbacteria bacterium]|nr:DNA replication/repair protein RecF [Candidatus Schekmanbacteria bacterium]